MPLYVYRCPHGHETEHLTAYDDRDEPHPCLVCAEEARRIVTAHTTKRDGTYSYRSR